jgi:hypothetical protein
LQYKYLVRNSDGGVSQWKPGSNYRFSLEPVPAGSHAVLPGGAIVRDAWDGSVRDVRVEVEEDGMSRAMTDAEREQDAFRESVSDPEKAGAAAGGRGQAWDLRTVEGDKSVVLHRISRLVLGW